MNATPLRCSIPWIPIWILLLLAAFAVPASIPRAGASSGPGAGADAGWRLQPKERADVESLGPRLIKAITTPDAAARQTIIGDVFSPEVVARVGMDRIAGQLARIGGELPGLEFEAVELAEGRRSGKTWRVLHVYARQPGSTMLRDLQVYISESAPYRLDRLAFIAEVTEPVYLPNGAITDPETLEWLNSYVDRLADTYDLSGGALIAVGDSIVFERYFGHADAARKRPITPETCFSLASASKMFTALGIARLVAEGRLHYSDTIDRYFPDFPDPAFARKVTIGHLLSHMSGVAEYWTQETTEALRAVRTTADVLPFVYRAGTHFEPGTRYEYSNSNFILAGLIIEQVSGRSFEQFIAGLITEPIGLRDTGPFASTDTSRSLTEPLGRSGDGWITLPRGIRGTAAGGWCSTPRDMHRFLRALEAGRIVSKEMLNTMLTSKTAALPESDEDYGYGFILQDGGGVASFGHGGTAPGVNAEIRCFPAPGIVIAVLSNQDNGAYDDLRRNITRLITGER